MAEQWIKMRVALRDDPRVVAIALRLGQERATVLGYLYLMWCIADAHGDFMPGVTPQALSRLLGLDGFAESLPRDWLQVRQDGLRFPDYERHNGSTAKRRAVEAARKADARKVSATDADTKRTKSAPE